MRKVIFYLSVLLSSIISSIISVNSFAGNLSFLDNSTITYFSEEDKTLMLANIINALDNNKDGSKSEWRNPKSAAFGYAIPVKTRTINGRMCRSVKTYNNAKGVVSKSVYSACKFGKQWKFVKRGGAVTPGITPHPSTPRFAQGRRPLPQGER